MRRSKKRFDYKALHTRGLYIEINQTPVMSSEEDKPPTPRETIIAELLVDFDVINDILDYIDETSESMVADEVILKLENFRTKFRTKHYKLRHYVGEELYNNQHKPVYDETISKIKDSIYI